MNANREFDQKLFEKLLEAKKNKCQDLLLSKPEIDRLFEAFASVKKSTLIFGSMQKKQRDWIL